MLKKLACMQNRRDDTPNRELARELAEENNIEAVKELAENLYNKDKKIQGDCISVLYWIGTVKPGLIEDHASDFLKLLHSKNNRLVWGSMLALSTIADRKPGEIFYNMDDMVKAIERGSVITVDNGIKTLAIVASVNDEYNRKIFPFLINHLKTCRPKEVPQHSESIFVAVNPKNRKEYTDVLYKRQDILTASQSARIKRLLKRIEEI
ncbi:MAG: hypothetical protein A7316_05295 [Candidatus Altiarchaeales archaeon WOR_SM1_86-2]|nr:MAG: hypothetical protein A7316_05295 [Candidatus Altiarchaeales archaeon WOR_SM1_86-2]ODS40509.1 MAG: hypothetical protein A7315_08265 [Candidatus Altiarchaeales archaeon WOR_SM1_79]